MEKEQSKSGIYNEAANWRLSRLFVPACGQNFDWPIAAYIQMPRHNQKDNQETPRVSETHTSSLALIRRSVRLIKFLIPPRLVKTLFL